MKFIQKVIENAEVRLRPNRDSHLKSFLKKKVIKKNEKFFTFDVGSFAVIWDLCG